MDRMITSLPAVSTPANSAANQQVPGLLGLVARRLTNWNKRRRIGRIEELTDRMLDDIGVTRADLIWVRSLSLDHNPLAALNSIARQRRAARFDDLRSPLSRIGR